MVRESLIPYDRPRRSCGLLPLRSEALRPRRLRSGGPTRTAAPGAANSGRPGPMCLRPTHIRSLVALLPSVPLSGLTIGYSPALRLAACGCHHVCQTVFEPSRFFFRFHKYYLLVRGSRIAGTFLRLPCRITGTNFLACHPQFFFSRFTGRRRFPCWTTFIIVAYHHQAVANVQHLGTVVV